MEKNYGKGCSANSELCKALRTPKDDDEKSKLYVTAFTAAPIYKTIINQFNGKTTTIEGLKIYLIREHNFSDSGAKTASEIFVQNANILGLIDSDNVFNIDSEIVINTNVEKQRKHRQQSNTTVSKTKTTPTPKVEHKYENTTHNSGNSGKKKISIYVRGEELTLNVLENMNQNDWDAIIKQIQNIKSFAK